MKENASVPRVAGRRRGRPGKPAVTTTSRARGDRHIRITTNIIISVIISAVVTYWMAGRQEVRAQQAVDKARARAELDEPPIFIGTYSVDTSLAGTWVLPSDKGIAWPRLVRDLNSPHPSVAFEAARGNGGLLQNLVTNENGAFAAFSKSWTVTVVGSRSEPVLIKSIHTRVVTKGPAFEGAVIYPGPYGTGGTTTEVIGFDSTA